MTFSGCRMCSTGLGMPAESIAALRAGICARDLFGVYSLLACPHVRDIHHACRHAARISFNDPVHLDCPAECCGAGLSQGRSSSTGWAHTTLYDRFDSSSLSQSWNRSRGSLPGLAMATTPFISARTMRPSREARRHRSSHASWIAAPPDTSALIVSIELAHRWPLARFLVADSLNGLQQTHQKLVICTWQKNGVSADSIDAVLKFPHLCYSRLHLSVTTVWDIHRPTSPFICSRLASRFRRWRSFARSRYCGDFIRSR